MARRIESIPFDGHLVLIKDGCEIIALNQTARLIWEALAEGATVAGVASKMAERFGLSRERASAEIGTALSEWRACGLIADGTIHHKPSQGPRARPARTPPTQVAVERTFALCGRPVRFRFQDAEAESLLCPLLAPSEVDGTTGSDVIDLYKDGGEHVIAVEGAEIGRCRSAEEVLELALGRVLEVSYPDARWLAMFHAGAVADDHHAILLPGVSGSGKSTLTAALVHVGFRYLSDDVAPLDGRTLHVMPMPFAVSLKRGSWPVVATWFPNLDRVPTISDGWRQRRYLAMPTDRGSDWGAGVPVRALVFPRHRPNGRARKEQIGSGEALGNLLQAGGWVSLDRQDLSRMLEWLLATPAYTIAFNSAYEACALLADL